MPHQAILYSTDGPIANISFNRSERRNTIVSPIPEETAASVDTANLDSDIPDSLFITYLLRQLI